MTTTSPGATLTSLADIDGDGQLDIVEGRRAWKANGTVLWDLKTGTNAIPFGYHAVGDFDKDGTPEVVVIASGGVSVGEADFVKAMLDRLGEVVFWKIAMKPGRPLAYGHIGGAHFFGLPGNPVSSYVCALLFAVPLLRKLTGRTLHCYLNPERDMPAEAEKIHGLSAEFLSDKPLFAIEAIRKHKSAYLMAVGGAAYLVSKAIKAAKVVGFADLGMEAIYEFDVKDMPVTVAVDSSGTSVHNTGPKEWQARIGKIPVAVA